MPDTRRDVIVSRVPGRIPSQALLEILRRAKRFARMPVQSIVVVMCSPIEIQKLNLRYRKINRPTDVLSFLYGASTSSRKGESVLGEIIICLSIARKQARQFGQSLTDELRLLTVHGFLHIIGYDHHTPRQASLMRRAENSILGSSLSRI